MATADIREKPSVRIKEPVKEHRGSRPPPLDVGAISASTSIGPRTPSLHTPRHEKEKKLGHRRVDQAGQVTYKKKPTSELMAAMQLGIGQSITSLAVRPKRDLLLQDFTIVETVIFPREGSNLTPAHHYSDFRFKTYAPVAFRYFRELFGIQPDDFLLSLCNESLRELSNPGASGSIFYISSDDEFIIKTVQHKEADFLQKLLPGYYMNLNQNPRTLLPKFYGLYCYQCGNKNIRFVVMNNLLPSLIRMHEKYDLKGSTYKRKASKRERAKKSPTLKDLDFRENHRDGLMLEAETYQALIRTLERDCRVLQSFKIMDFSFLIGLHNLDQAKEDDYNPDNDTPLPENTTTSNPDQPTSEDHAQRLFARGRSVKRLAAYSTTMESIQANSDPVELENEDIPAGGIPARNSRGERILLYCGIIDILQSYRFKKKLEHAMKAMVHDGDTISVHRPGFYSQRFMHFTSEVVFKKIASPLKQSPSKRKSTSRQKSQTEETQTRTDRRALSSVNESAYGATGGRPDLLIDSSTPPTQSPAGVTTSSGGAGGAAPTAPGVVGTGTAAATQPRSAAAGPHQQSQGLAAASYTTTASSRVTVATYSDGRDKQHAATVGGGGVGAAFHVSPLLDGQSPAHSISESTPTHTEFTEGTPSFTASSPSCSSDVLDQGSKTTVHSGSVLSTDQVHLTTLEESTTRHTSSSSNVAVGTTALVQDGRTTVHVTADDHTPPPQSQPQPPPSPTEEVTHL